MSQQIYVYTKWYRKTRASLIKAFGGHCGACHKKLGRSNAEFAHFHNKPTELSGGSHGSFKRLKDICENPLSYWLACHACHEDYDRGHKNWRGQNNGGNSV